MQRYMLGTQAQGVAGMKSFCDLLQYNSEPTSGPVEYDTIDDDLTSVPIEAGFGHLVLAWTDLTQEDYNRLLDLQGDNSGACMYARLPSRSGTTGIDFANYSVMAKRPVFESRDGLMCRNVTMELVRIVAP
jgi:hypothetical protein